MPEGETDFRSRRLTGGLSAACPAGRYGAACLLECSCHNNGTCEPATGACHCDPGFYGQACEHCESWDGDLAPASEADLG